MGKSTALAIDPVTGRPVYQGLPVPWVARWTAEDQVWERTEGPIVASFIGGRLHIAYAEPDPAANPFGLEAGFQAQRDQLGVLWFRNRPHRQGKGVPQFAQIHPLRQRACMLERLCQVCGKPFSGTEPVTFLVGGRAQSGRSPRGPFRTGTPPCCSGCVPTTLAACPAQRRKDRLVVRAYDYEPSSVLAAIYAPDGLPGGLVDSRRMWVGFDNPILTQSLGMQLEVQINDYDETQV